MTGHYLKSKENVISIKVFVGNLNYDTTQSDLEALFSQAGQVVEVFLPTDRDTGRPRGFAFVEFTEQSSIAEAIEKFDGYLFKDRTLEVKKTEEKQRRPSNFSDSGPSGYSRGPKGSKPKGSRRNIRARKRGH